MSIVGSGVVMQGGIESIFVNLLRLGFLLTTTVGLVAVYGQAIRLTFRTLFRPERTNYFRGLYLAVGLLALTAIGQVVFTSYVLTG